MRIVYLANNRVGWQVLRWLREQNANIVGLVVHPESRRKYGDDIISCVDQSTTEIFDASLLRNPETLKRIADLKPDIGLSIYFATILRPSFLGLFSRGVINLHPSYLPYNRGLNPNVWSIIDNTPAGVTLHYIDQGVDTGDIISQTPVGIAAEDTGLTLYTKLEEAGIHLFQKTWPAIKAGMAPRVPQVAADVPLHKKQELEQIDNLDLDRHYTGRELLNLLRARTFPPYSSAYFRDGDDKIFVRVQLEREVKQNS